MDATHTEHTFPRNRKSSILKRKAFPSWCVLLLDSLIIYGSLLLAKILVEGQNEISGNIIQVAVSLAAGLVCYLCSLCIFRTSFSMIRYSTFPDLLKLAGAVLLGSLFLFCAQVAIGSAIYFIPVSLLELAVASAFSILFMWVVRISAKVIYDKTNSSPKSLNALIIGTRAGGLSIAYSIMSQTRSPYIICGFVTHSHELAGHTLLGKPVVLFNSTKFWNMISKGKISAVFISPIIQKRFMENRHGVLERLISQGISIMTFPESKQVDVRDL